MSQKRIRSTLYMESKIKWIKHELRVEHDPDGFLFAGGKYRTKIQPEDFPEWFIRGYLYKRRTICFLFPMTRKSSGSQARMDFLGIKDTNI